MFGNKKPQPPSRSKQNRNDSKQRNLAQFGFLDMGLVNDAAPMEEDDDDLEAELAALTQGSGNRKKKSQPKRIPSAELDAMVASSLKDIPSDAEISDVDDADVEEELNELCQGSDDDDTHREDNKHPSAHETINIVQERLSMYLEAENNAKSSGDTMKAKRFGRGVKSLQDMQKQLQMGKTIDVNEIPPILPTSALKKAEAAAQTSTTILPQTPLIPKPVTRAPVVPVPTITNLAAVPEILTPEVPTSVPKATVPPAPTFSTNVVRQSEIDVAVSRRNEYKSAALQAKRNGDQQDALRHVRFVKVCDQLISKAQGGEAVDWSQLPPPPSQEQDRLARMEVEAPRTAEPKMEIEAPKAEVDSPATNALVSDSAPSVAVPMQQPRTALEALEQRLAKYQSQVDQAQGEGNSSKVRRMGRIVKQYQDAIKQHKAGKAIPFDELPTPPGFPPIPGAPLQSEAAPPHMTPNPQENISESQENLPPRETPAVRTVSPAVPPKPAAKKTALATRQDKQLAMLLERQNLFKQAALEAKKSGEIEQAKEYLRMSKGIDPLINANKCGIPVDMDTLPVPPQMKSRPKTEKDQFEILSSEECALAPSLSSDTTTMFSQLEADLVKQLKMCSENREHYKLLGDVANSNRFDQLALHTRKDLDVVRSAAMRGDPVPRWKNEIKMFSIVKCCTDLKDDDMEIHIIRGLAYNVPNPKTVDTYVRFEVPIPNSDNPTKDKTNTVKDTNNPEYNQTFLVNISRQSRTALRIFKGKSVKFEIWSKGGFLRSDTLLGTATVKLADLLNHCVIHEAVDLVDGRKPVGGKLEVKIRLRDPVIGKEVEQIQEKWTVLVHDASPL